MDTDDPLRFLDPHAVTVVTQNRLPHWDQSGAVYFVTFRLADAVPASLREQWAAERASWLELNPPPHSTEQKEEYRQRFSDSMDAWLDAGHGSCLLSRIEAAECVASALAHFDGVRYQMFSYVVMPNHMHALFAAHPDHCLHVLVHSWKGFTSHSLRGLLGANWVGWQKDYFDRLIRDEAHFENCVRYIRQNPQKASLTPGQFFLFESALAQSIH